eukprot:Phypoly_transcript_19238.p1 GENE.Phypoly_transcript_19238~~Phypoly_transcript_19238.p1  ORF type:complete len:211 (-),score=35.98 Phypoly_transcript_19238:56-688(-)
MTHGNTEETKDTHKDAPGNESQNYEDPPISQPLMTPSAPSENPSPYSVYPPQPYPSQPPSEYTSDPAQNPPPYSAYPPQYTAYPPQPYPHDQTYPPQPYPNQPYPAQPYPAQSYPAPYPTQPYPTSQYPPAQPVVVQPSAHPVDHIHPLPCGGMGVAWVLFILGWFIGIAWIFGAFYACGGDPRERRGGRANLTILCIWIAIIIVIVVAN